MIKKTIYLGNPYYICLKNQQIELQVPEGTGIDKVLTKTIPIEDIGVIILDHQQLTLTHPVLQQIAAHNTL